MSLAIGLLDYPGRGNHQLECFILHAGSSGVFRQRKCRTSADCIGKNPQPIRMIYRSRSDLFLKQRSLPSPNIKIGAVIN